MSNPIKNVKNNGNNSRPARRKTRLSQRIGLTVQKLNELMAEAHKNDLEIILQVDRKQLPFPIFAVRVMKEIKGKESVKGRFRDAGRNHS